MKPRTLRCLCASLIFLLPTGALGQDDNANKRSPDSAVNESEQNITQTLRDHYRAGRFESGYEYGKRHQLEMEGEKQFDFFFGLTALHSGHLSEALFTFERLVALHPNQPRFRLEYARTLFRVGQYDQSRRQFQRVLQQDPPQTVKSNIQRYLDSIEQREEEGTKTWSGKVALGGGYDTNINNATDEKIIGFFELPESSRETESGFATANTELTYHRPLNQLSSFRLDLGTRHKKNLETSEFDLDSGTLSMAWNRRVGKNQLSPMVSYQHVLLDGEEYQRNIGVAGQWRRSWSANLMTVLYAGIFQRDSFANPLLDNYQPLISFNTLIADDAWLHSLGLAAGSENAREDDVDHLVKEFVSLSYRAEVKVSPRVTPFMKVSGFAADYKDTNPIFGETREDRSGMGTLGVEWQMSRQFALEAETGYTHNASTIDLFDYTRWKTEVQASWQF